MSNEAITDSAGLSGPVKEKAAPRKRTASSTRATKKVAKDLPVENVVVEAMDNNSETEDGQKVITGPKKTRSARNSNSFTTDTGAIGSRAADYALSKKVDTTVKEQDKDDKDKVAVWSEKNIRWANVGSIVKGYNIVTKEAAELWLTKQGIREATPEEVATYYSK